MHAAYGWVQSIWGDPGGQIFALMGASILHYDGTSWSRLPRPPDDTGRDLWGSSPSDLFVVGWGGDIFHYDGASWSSLQSGTTATLYSVWGSGPDDVFAVGDNSTILHYDGSRWTVVLLPGPFPQWFRDVWGRSSSDVFVLSSHRVLHYDGTTWEVVHESGGSVLWGNDDQLYVAHDWPNDGIVLHYDGVTWNGLETGSAQGFVAAWGSSANDAFLVGTESVLHWDGSTWSESFRIDPRDEAHAPLRCIWGMDHDTVFIGGSHFLHYDGSRWSPLLGLVDPVRAGCAVSDTEYFTFGGYDDPVYFYDGTEWNSLGVFYGYVSDAWGNSATDLFVVGTHDNDGGEEEDGYTDGYAYHYDGTNWYWGWSPRGLTAVWGSSGSDVFAVGPGGNIVHYDGAAWSQMPSGTTSDLFSVWGSSSADVFAAGTEGSTIVMLHYDGATWSLMSRHESTHLYPDPKLWGSSARDVYMACKAFLLHYDGTAWSPVNLGTANVVSKVWGRSASDVYVAGDQGILHYDGSAWSPLELEELGPVWEMWGGAHALFLADYKGIYRYGPE